MKFCAGGAKFFLWMDRQTDMMKLIIVFTILQKPLKNTWGNLRDNAMHVVYPMES
jgi:hypothetical protein